MDVINRPTPASLISIMSIDELYDLLFELGVTPSVEKAIIVQRLVRQTGSLTAAIDEVLRSERRPVLLPICQAPIAEVFPPIKEQPQANGLGRAA